MVHEPPTDGAVTLLRYQVELADAIRNAEACLKRSAGAAEDIAEHIARVRFYGDGLVWLVLHPHAIRQVAKNASVDKNILGQGPAFDGVIASAGLLCVSTGVPILIADITNVIRIGDLLVVADKENPTIVECKSRLPDTQHLMQGRIGRQISRSVGTARYMGGDTTKVYGDDHHRVVIEADHERAWHWDEVEEVLRAGVTDGLAASELSSGNWIWAVRRGRENEVTEEIVKIGKISKEAKWQFGTASGGRDDVYPPPCVWPVEPDLQFEIAEGSLAVLRMFNREALAGDYDDGMKIEIGEGDFLIVAHLGDQEFRLSARFADDALYGYERVDSCVRGILEFVRQIDPSVNISQAAGSKPRIHQVESGHALLDALNQSGVFDHDLIAIREEELSQLPLGEVVLTEGGGGAVSLYQVGELRQRVVRRQDETPDPL